jgi:HK97 gp10 family phage protein
MDEEVTITGLEDVERKLQELGPKLAKEALVDALQAGGAILKQALEEFAPIGPSKDPHQGALQGSIEMLTYLELLNDRGIISIGPDRRVFWGRFSEFGTCKEPARPWMRPAFDSAKQQALDKFIAVLEERIPQLVSGGGQQRDPVTGRYM